MINHLGQQAVLSLKSLMIDKSDGDEPFRRMTF